MGWVEMCLGCLVMKLVLMLCSDWRVRDVVVSMIFRIGLSSVG